MARTRTVEAPASSDVYFGMVLCSFVAILASVGLLLWELVGTYGFESSPAAISAPALPKVPARSVAPAGGTAAAPMPEPEKPVVALTPAETPAPAATAPSPLVAVPPAPIPPAVVPTPPVATPAASPAPTGPVPGFSLPKRN